MCIRSAKRATAPLSPTRPRIARERTRTEENRREAGELVVGHNARVSEATQPWHSPHCTEKVHQRAEGGANTHPKSTRCIFLHHASLWTQAATLPWLCAKMTPDERVQAMLIHRPIDTMLPISAKTRARSAKDRQHGPILAYPRRSRPNLADIGCIGIAGKPFLGMICKRFRANSQICPTPCAVEYILARKVRESAPAAREYFVRHSWRKV